MAANPRRKISISLLIPFLVVILFFTAMVWQKYRSSRAVPAIPSQLQQAEGSRVVTLFFAAEGTRLARESREIDPCRDDNDCLKSVLDELLSGPVGDFDETLPEGTAVLAARIEGNQATVDVNRAFSEAMLSGSAAEMLAVYSLVNTVATNFPGVQKIKLTVEGNGATVLRHLDLTEPLLPDFTMEQSLKVEPKKTPVK
jgi:spore germination protein GerM